MKTAFLFSGQGAQYPGMMKDIYDNSTAARRIFELADELSDRSISSLCFNGSDTELNLTHNTQPCLLTVEVAAYEALKAKGSVPDAVAGFSLGEYAALVAAGVFSFSDALKVVQIRADAMQRAVPLGEGAMAAVQTSDQERVERLCRASDGYVVGANYNCSGQTVVSGEKKAIQSFCKLSKAEGIKATRLPVSAPFHCKLMEPAKEELAAALENIEMKDAVFPVYMNVDAMPEQNANRIRQKLIEQTVSPVYWEKTIRNMARDGINDFVEIGPGDTLTKFVKIILDNKLKGEYKMELEKKMELLADLLDVEVDELTPETRLDELPWNSLAVLSFIVMMEEEFDKEIGGSEIKKFVTIQDVLDVMES